MIEIDVAEAAEVLMSICAVADRGDHDTFDLGAEWLDARLESLPDDLREQVLELRLGRHEGGRAPARDRLRDAGAADVRRLHGAARGDRPGRAEAASLRPLRHDVGPHPARHRRGRRPRRRGRDRAGARGARRVVGQARALPRPPADGRSRGEGADRRPASPLVRARLRTTRAGVARGGRAGCGGQVRARAEPLAGAVRRAGDARLPVQPAGGDPQDRLLPELVHAPLGDPLGAQEHEDLLLPDRARRPRRAPRRPRSRGSTRHSATRAG